MSANKDVAEEIYKKHMALASVDGRLFRKTVREEVMATTGCSPAAASTYYNNSKKSNPVIAGLGRAPAPKGLKKPGNKPDKAADEILDDDECFTVIELVKSEKGFTVGRCQSFELQGEASEKFDSKIEVWPNSIWFLIQGLGPNHGESFKLEQGEIEIKRHDPKCEVPCEESEAELKAEAAMEQFEEIEHDAEMAT